MARSHPMCLVSVSCEQRLRSKTCQKCGGDTSKTKASRKHGPAAMCQTPPHTVTGACLPFNRLFRYHSPHVHATAQREARCVLLFAGCDDLI